MSFSIQEVYLELKLNLWLTALKGAKPVNKTSETDWQMTARRDNVISITHCQVLIISATSPSSSYPIFFTRLGGPRSRQHLKFVEVPGIEPTTS